MGQPDGGSICCQGGFGQFYSKVVAGLAKALGGEHRTCPLGAHVARLRNVLGDCRRSQGKGLKHSPGHVFLLPPLSVGGDSNLVIAILNYYLHGEHEVVGHRPILSAAHRRVHARLLRTLEAMVLTDEPVMSNEGLDMYLKQSEHYSGGGVVLALGAEGVELHLRDTFPEMAQQVIQPSMLMMPSKRRPRRVKRGYTRLAPFYPELVKRNVKAGLHCWKKPSQVAKHRGVPCLAGAFAVRKDANEDRVITDPSVNQLIDQEKLPRPRFAYIPKLRAVTVPASGIVMVSKRDARHYSIG
ncbi:lon [Symbiodinium sp. CCMP2592]|nr:lon [Symbiodinium sp. CCMP2592]